jgi:murein DD-endopeptidase MepM/ murein hydrolase activator NlpD
MNLLRRVSQFPCLFNGISWGVTALIVVSLLGGTVWKIYSPASSTLELTPTETGAPDLNPTSSSAIPLSAITRHISLKTNISGNVHYDIIKYTVSNGDSIAGIAQEHDLKTETVFWANYDLFQGSPDSLRIGQVLSIPPVDGVYYKWQEGDTIESVAKKLGVEPDAILNWPGNNVDLTDPQIAPGTFVMIPGGQQAGQPLYIQTITRGSGPAATACGGGYSSRGFWSWPAASHYLSGNDYSSFHRGIDIAANEGTGISAADSGVVTMAQGGSNYGYGNVVQIDHGNGFVTLYAHLSQINVVPCEAVNGGEIIGLAGNTGNSSGAHLHFEIRLNGTPVNPWDYLLP